MSECTCRSSPDTDLDLRCVCKQTEPAPAKSKGSAHYRKGGDIEPIDLILSQDLGFCEGNVVKYIVRHKHSGESKEDLMKAKHYIEFLLEKL